MVQPKRILVPMDFSHEALFALNWALMLAQEPGEISVFPAYVYSARPGAAAEDIRGSADDEVTETWAKEQRAAIQWNCVYAKGDPAEEIAVMCRLQKIDLVIMATRGRVPEAIVRSAPCPVFLLNMNPIDTEAEQQPERVSTGV